MTVYQLREKQVRTRTRHWCEWCNEPIASGEPSQYREYLLDGAFVRGWMHPECHFAMAQVERYELDDGWTPGDYPRGGREYIGY